MTKSETLFSRADLLFENGAFSDSFKCFLNLAEQGDVDAMTRVASMYADGVGIVRNFKKSIFWDKKAAKLGSSSAMLNVAITYRCLGELEQAVVWFKKALSSGNEEAALHLAKIYMICCKKNQNVKELLMIARDGKYVCQDSRDEASKLLKRCE
ncbi:MAG: sel1 repeat family protein [Gammaproteobacteria bacterium]|nr:sel1 repeat family protein [Gammaproteobacteria bacterium]